MRHPPREIGEDPFAPEEHIPRSRHALFILFVLCALAAPWRPCAAAAALDTVRVGLMSLEAPRGERRVLEALAIEAPGILARIESDLGIYPASRFRMVLLPPGEPSDPDLRRLDAAAPWWAAGFTLPAARVCVIRASQAGHYPYGSLEAVLAHEATHLILHDALGDRLPLWFEEGVATREGRQWEFRDVVAYSTSLLTSALPRLAELDSSFHGSAAEAQLAYAGSHAFVARTVHAYGPGVVRDLLRETRRRPFQSAWLAVTGETLEHAETGWRRSSLIRYRWFPLLATSSTLWLAITLLTLLAGFRKRALARRLRERWAREEAEESEAMTDLEDAETQAPDPSIEDEHGRS